MIGPDRQEANPVFHSPSWWALILAVVLAIAYGSLIPFDFDLGLLGNSWGISALSWVRPSLEDLIVNVVLYMPLGALMFARARHGQPARGVLLGTLFGLALSLTLECLQTAMRHRVGSWVDVTLNTFGTSLGFCGAWIFGPIVAAILIKFRRMLIERPFRSLWVFVVLGYIFLQLYPCDFIRSSVELENTLRRTNSFQIWQNTETLASALRDSSTVLLAMLTGYLGLVAAYERRDRTDFHGVSIQLTHSVIMLASLEMVQLFTRSHSCDLRDLLVNTLCAGVGVTLAGMALRRVDSLQELRNLRRSVPTPILLGALLIQVASLVLPAWLRHATGQHATMATIEFTIPFESLWQRPMSRASAEIVSQFVSFASVVSMIAILLRRLRIRRAWFLSGVGVIFLAGTVVWLQARSSGGRAGFDATSLILAFVSVLIVSTLYPRLRPFIAPATIWSNR